jgi:hypothetical protein
MSAIPLPPQTSGQTPRDVDSSMQVVPWRHGLVQWALLGVGLAALVLCHWAGLEFMVATWQTVEEYSYGWFVPAISAFLIWQRSDRLRQMELQGSW